jgi:glutaconate CoA-transferase subunit B
MPDYTPAELMVVAAAREIKDREVVFVGMRLPLLAFSLAKRTHAPNAIGLFENGLVRDTQPPPDIYTMSDSPNVVGAAWATGLIEVMSLLQRGDVDLGFIGGAEVDRHGNINTTMVGSRERPKTWVKLPGSGGAADIACLARRLVSLMQHEPHRLRERVDFITSPGFGDDGPDWRQRQGLVRGGPSALITTLGVLRFDKGEAVLASYHPFTTPQEVQARTGWPLRLGEECRPTPEPTADELRLIREADPHRFWTR